MVDLPWLSRAIRFKLRAVEWMRVRFAPVFAALALWSGACSTADLKTPVPQGQSGDPSVDPGSDDPGGDADGGRGSGADGGGALVTTSSVTIQVQPSDSGYAVLNAIKGAKKSVHMTMYLLTSNEMIDALVNQKKAGRDVKVVLNQTFPPNGGSNADSYATLKSNGVDVVWAPSAYQFTHAKTILIDGEKLIAMTMNLTYTSPTTNREYIATDTDPQDVADAEKIFDADFRNVNLYLPSTKLVVSPNNATGVDARTRLKALIDSAKTSLDVEAQSLSDETLVQAIIAAKNASVDVKVVLDADTLHTTGQEEALAKLLAAKVPVRGLKNPDIHAKAIVADGVRAFVGSMNLTPTALNANREVGIITDAQAEAAKVSSVIAGDFTKGTTP